MIQGIGIRCKARGIPAVALVGSMGRGAENIFEYGIESIMTTVNGAMPLSEALDRAEELYLDGARRMFRMLRAGKALSRENGRCLAGSSARRVRRRRAGKPRRGHRRGRGEPTRGLRRRRGGRRGVSADRIIDRNDR